MPKDQYIANLPDQSPTSISDDPLTCSLPARSGPYRSLSAKRPRDPSHRKSVSFNDVPIVHEVPSHDAMRNSNCTTYRSWTYTDATPATPTVPSFYTSQMLSPFNSTSAAAQKLHANRMSSSLYSSLSTNTTASRMPDWAVRAKPLKTNSTADETNLTSEQNATWSPPTIVVHAPDEKTNKEPTGKTNLHSTYNNPYVNQAQSSPPAPPNSSLSINNVDNGEEKKHPYRSPIISDTEHHRILPFSYEPMSDSTAIYTSMLSTNLVSSNHSSNEQPTHGYTRTARARSATLPITITHSTLRGTDTVSITPFRAPTATLLPNGTIMPSRAVLRPTTIAFQCSQPTTTTTPTATSNGSSTIATNITNNYTSTINSSLAPNNSFSGKPPAAPPRFASSAAAAAAAHSRFSVPSNRAFPPSSLVTSTIKYAFTHPTIDSALTNSSTPQNTGAITKAPPTAYPRSRSANVLSTRRNVTASAGILMDNHSIGNSSTSAANPTTNLYSTAKRNPNVRQNYGSYYMHRVLLPTTIN